MEFSVGILYSSQAFLAMARRIRLTSKEFPAIFERIEVADAKSVLAICQQCAWIRISENGVIAVTERGITISELGDGILCLREQLADAIVATRPSWSKQIPRGRFETLKILPAAGHQCLNEAELLKDISDDVVEWWRKVASRVRYEQDFKRADTGFEAERNTLKHEEKRTGEAPRWQGFETTVSGFDVLSVVTGEDKQRLKIEVKGTKSHLKEAVFFLTRNEWNTAAVSSNYVFHLWLLGKPLRFFCVDKSVMAAHIPTDNNMGEWQTAKIPFNQFVTHEMTPFI